MEHILKQYRVFKKHWEKSLNQNDLDSAGTADTVRRKLAVGLEEFLAGMENDDEKQTLAPLFAELAESVEFHILLRAMNEVDFGDLPYEMKLMAEKALQLDESNFVAAECLAYYGALNLMHTSAGSSPVLYKGEDTATSIVGTAFNLLGKGLALGFTAAGSGITKASFNSSVHKMIENYKLVMASSDTKIGRFVNYSLKMFNIAEICEAERNSLWKDIYAAICEVELDSLDRSGDDKDLIARAEERAEELWILAEAKV